MPEVEQITLNGRNARSKGQTILFITERAVFRALDDGLHLIELADGVDMERDVLAHIPFPVTVDECCRKMDAGLFV